MNIIQRIILVLGVIGLAVALQTTPRYYRLKNGDNIDDWTVPNSYTLVHKEREQLSLRKHFDMNTALLRLVVVVGATAGLVLVFADKKNKEGE